MALYLRVRGRGALCRSATRSRSMRVFSATLPLAPVASGKAARATIARAVASAVFRVEQVGEKEA